MYRKRLIIAIVSTTIEEAIFVVAVVCGLPKLGITVPVWGILPIMAAWAGYAVYSFRKGTEALAAGPILGLPNMIGMKGRTIETLDPEGRVKINTELWSARSLSGPIGPDSVIIVKGQKRLKLEVVEEVVSDDTSGTSR